MLKLLLCLCFFLCAEIDPPEVLTNLGHVKGKWMTSREDKRYLAFLGVPYAKPPIGELRFKDPVEFGSWSGIIDATRQRDDCPQWSYQSTTKSHSVANVTGSEDCLYLNIYTPDTRYGSLLPVIVYFYGGGFVTGSAVKDRGAAYWMDERIVLVTVSYRIGPLGFLSLEDEELPGNMGLKDQLLALKWIRQNIPAFGGHPKRITIMGESAGGASVNLHMLSPRSRGLFQQAISMSGTAYVKSIELMEGEARRRALDLAQVVGCNSNTSKDTVDCLRNVPFENITFALNNFMDEGRYPLMYYLPVMDSAAVKPFLPTEPKKLEQANVPWLVGVSSGEGLFETARYQVIPSFSWKNIDQNFSDYIGTALFMNNIPTQDINMDELRQFYFGDQPIDERSFTNMTNLFSDGFIIYPTYIGLKRKTGPLYYYYFDYLGDNSYADRYGPKRLINASHHTDEEIYLWEMTNTFPPLKGDDIILSKSFVKLWTNFAKCGSPTTKESVITWERYNKNHRYLHIHNDGFSLEKNLLEKRMHFWENLFPY